VQVKSALSWTISDFMSIFFAEEKAAYP